jgi:hypothetical protein
MFLPFPLLLALVVSDSTQVYAGRLGQLQVALPRIEADIEVDGRLTESPWSQAALLTGFSQYAPSDGVPAADSTEVLVWYSRTAIYFGIRAFEPHGAVHATLADRDRIFSDDNVQILLGTFNDGRQATLFAVNPLGVQGDGVIVEGSAGNAGTGIGVSANGREAPDLSPDYVFQSRGVVTDWGYTIEVRIPFKTLRYQQAREQNWGINIVRQVKHSGFEDSWAPARRASTTFLGQSGRFTGLTELHRGLVMDLNPEVTNKVTGTPGVSGYSYDVGNPQIGGNVRWGVTNNLTANGTVKPDFSQVESDAGQLAFDPRLSLFFPEKRPFFLDGSEQFQVPSQLIYTRRILQPVVAAKLTGKALGTDIGFLSALDDKAASSSGNDNPLFAILRIQRDVGNQSRLGLAVTNRSDRQSNNQVGDLDGRLLFSRIYSFQFQAAASRTSQGPTTTIAPLWRSQFDINGHRFGFTAALNGISDQFRSDAGFVQRPGFVQSFIDPRVIWYGKPGGLIQSLIGDAFITRTWQYQSFIHGRGRQDQKLHLNGNATLRGGWSIIPGLFIESFGYDSSLYSSYALEVPKTGGGLDTIPFTGQPRIANIEGYLQINTPQWKSFDANVFGLRGNDENFFEWASADLTVFHLGINWRPTDRARIGFTYDWQQVDRRTDGSTVHVGRIPRLKLEYQLSRPIFVRLVSQYVQQRTDSLGDDSRTGAPILIAGPGGFQRSAVQANNVFQFDALFSYQPTPGTVVFVGYGSTMDEPEPFHFDRLTRLRDGFFAKVSYIFRL